MHPIKKLKLVIDCQHISVSFRRECVKVARQQSYSAKGSSSLCENSSATKYFMKSLKLIAKDVVLSFESTAIEKPHVARRFSATLEICTFLNESSEGSEAYKIMIIQIQKDMKTKLASPSKY